jgi:hypothetical protein
MLHDDYAAEPGGEPEGIGYTTLATSRDGRHWERHDDIFFDRNPAPGTWDRAMTWIGSVLPVDDQLYIYFGGYARGHKSDPQKERQIGLAFLPNDRFVARTAIGDDIGELVTVPLKKPAGADSLYLNADASGGEIQVQLLDEDGVAIEGATYDDHRPLDEDGLRINVSDLTWPANHDVIRIAFRLKNASIYTFQWGE